MSSSLRIVMINTSDTIGGAAQINWQLSQSLRELGHNVDILVDQKNTQSPFVHQLSPKSIDRLLPKVGQKDFRAFFLNYRSHLFANDQVWGVGKSILNHPLIKQADIIHCHNLHGNYFQLANLVELTAFKPSVWTLHDMWPLTARCAHSLNCQKYTPGCNQCPYLNTYQSMAWDNTNKLWNHKRKIYQQSKLHLVSPSPWMSRNISQSILAEQDLSEIPNGVDTKVFKPLSQVTSRDQLGLPQDKKIITFIAQGGANNPYKGWQYFSQLVSAYATNPDIIFLVIGGSESGGDNQVINIPYQTDRHKLSQYYNATDVLVFPSFAESFGLVPLESLLCGTPVAAFPVGIIPNVISHLKNGYIAKQNDVQDLKTGVDYLLEHSLQGATLKVIQDKYSLESMTKAYLELYQRLISDFQ
jgi:glycosyltransferase involved in cell wall biosynthesis